MRPDFKPRVFQVSEKLPRPGKWVFVITASYRCMGYLDANGTWRDIQRAKPIEGVQAWSAATEEETALWAKEKKD